MRHIEISFTNINNEQQEMSQSEITRLFEATLMFTNSENATIEIDKLILIQIFLQRMLNSIRNHSNHSKKKRKKHFLLF